MTPFEILALPALAAAFAGLVHYVRHDGFAASTTPSRDELGTVLRPALR